MRYTYIYMHTDLHEMCVYVAMQFNFYNIVQQNHKNSYTVIWYQSEWIALWELEIARDQLLW